MDKQKQELAKQILQTVTYSDMDDQQMSLVVEYETEIFKKRLDKLTSKSINRKENWIHKHWLNYEMADGTEDNLYSILNMA